MSEVKTDKISPRTASGTLTVGDSGDTLTVPSGVTFNAAVTGSGAAITALNATNLATGTVPTARLGSSGTASATTFLRGDNSWASAGGDNTPAFQAKLGTDQTLSHDTVTIVTFDTEIFDTDGAYDNTTNYRFTVPSGEGGKYWVYAKVGIEGPGQTTVNYAWYDIYKNGSPSMFTENRFRANPAEGTTMMNAGIFDLAAADYLDVRAYIVTTSTSAGTIKQYSSWTTFGAYKLIGL